MMSFPKPIPHVVVKRKQRADREKLDREERAKCHQRSGGRCEVLFVTFKSDDSAIYWRRCNHRASQNHHLLGGNGRRNVGASIYAAHRIDICTHCHQDINAGLLQPTNRDEQIYATQVKYERVKA